MTVGELIGDLMSAMGRGEVTYKTKVTVPGPDLDGPNKIVDGIITDVDGDEVELDIRDAD